MSTNEPGEHNWPNPRSDADLAIDPSTSPAVLASLAEDRPAVRHLVATNPSAPVHILMWLHELRDPAIDLALSRNPTATAANVVRPLSASTASAVPGAVDAQLAGAEVPQAAMAASATTVLERPARRWSTWAILLVPLLALGAVAALALRVRDNGPDKTARGATTGPSTSVRSTLAPAAASTQVTAATTPAPTAAPATPAAAAAPTEPSTEAPTPAPTPAPATTRKPTTATTRAATTVKPTTPPTTARPTASVSASTAVPPPTVLGVTVVPTTVAKAVSASTANAAAAIAQRLATALASSDWATARKLNPVGALSDAQYGKDYGNLTDSTLVPVSTTSVGGSVYNLRLGLVAHETTAAGVRSTLLYCVHWNVDTSAGTVVQIDGKKVRTATGRVEAAAVTAELKASCAAATLK